MALSDLASNPGSPPSSYLTSNLSSMLNGVLRHSGKFSWNVSNGDAGPWRDYFSTATGVQMRLYTFLDTDLRILIVAWLYAFDYKNQMHVRPASADWCIYRGRVRVTLRGSWIMSLWDQMRLLFFQTIHVNTLYY